jgi:uncharacterized protein YdiU (UPF0061 family)
MSGWNIDNSYTDLPERLFSRVHPRQSLQPSLVLYNQALEKDLGLNLSGESEFLLAEMFSGKQLPPGSIPVAQAYAGHQFGHFNILGDGRAILLGEQITHDQKRFDIQLKGSGNTPYSRRGDGLATLRSMLREYLISEAMYHLKIPTSRSLAVVKTGETVIRENENEGAVLTRIASSHIRVGTFEYAKRFLTVEEFKTFTNYVIKRHAPQFSNAENIGIALLKEVMSRQISLIIHWMRVGFIHGVMNTDNMSISGETIDYGPCAFMNAYHPDTVFSSIDTQGRYAYGNQPAIAQWNLACLTGTLLPLIDENQDKAIEQAKSILNEFPALYNDAWYAMMGRKIGLKAIEKDTIQLIDTLLEWMKDAGADYTTTFLHLMKTPLSQNLTAIFENEKFSNWVKIWEEKIKQYDGMDKAMKIMQATNPVFIPRNHLVEAALDAAVDENSYGLFHRVHDRLSNPYSFEEGYDEFFELPNGFDTNYKTFCGT